MLLSIQRCQIRIFSIFDTVTEKPLGIIKSLGTNLFGIDVTKTGEVFIAQTDAQNHINGRAGTKKHGLKQLMNRPYLNQVTKLSSRGVSLSLIHI